MSDNEETNIIRNQGEILRRQEELKNDLAALDATWKDLQADFESLQIRFEMWDDARLRASRDMQALDRMISQIRN